MVTLKKESKNLRGFYVPLFEVRIGGERVSPNVLRDVTEITYKDNIKGIDSFELTINNWNAKTNAFKYVGSEKKDDLQGNGDAAKHYRLFEPCGREVDIFMGYVGNLVLMVRGQFTTMEPSFPSGGAPTLSVRGLNVLHKLRRKQYTYAWTGKKDSEIAEDIGSLKDPKTKKKRFPLPIKIDKDASGKEDNLEYVAQKNQYDIDFLFGRAVTRGYVVVVREGQEDRHLYFGPSNAPDPLTYELTWGQSLIDFKPTLTTANQVRAVTVNGWNRRTKRVISERATLEDLRHKRNKDLYHLLEDKSCDGREEQVVDEPVFTKKQARERALAILSDQQKDMVKASGTTVGLPNLRAGTKVRIKGVGSRFSGTYFVTETAHSINDSGYITRFKARREDDGEGEAS